MANKKDFGIMRGETHIYSMGKEVNGLTPVEIRVFYEGLNQNGSYISSKVAEQMIKSVRGQPIVGNYIDEDQDFGSHEGKWTTQDGEMVYRHTNVPYGVVPLNARVWKEAVLDKYGKARTYYCVQGYVWTKRYPEAVTIIENNSKQSMELDERSLNGEWVYDGTDEYFRVDYAEISGLCVLGEDVLPCFEDSRFISYSIQENPTFVDLCFEMFKDAQEAGIEISGSESHKEIISSFTNGDSDNPSNLDGNLDDDGTTKGGKVMKKQINFALNKDSAELALLEALNNYDEEKEAYDLTYMVLEVNEDSALVLNQEDKSRYTVDFKKVDGEFEVSDPVKIVDGDSVDIEEYEALEEAKAELEAKLEEYADKKVLTTEEYEALTEDNEDLEGKVVVDSAEYETLKEDAEKAEALEEQNVEFSKRVKELETEKKEELFVEFEALGEELIAEFKAKADDMTAKELKQEMVMTAYDNGIQIGKKKDGQGVIAYTGLDIDNYDDVDPFVKAVLDKQKANKQ